MPDTKEVVVGSGAQVSNTIRAPIDIRTVTNYNALTNKEQAALKVLVTTLVKMLRKYRSDVSKGKGEVPQVLGFGPIVSLEYVEIDKKNVPQFRLAPSIKRLLVHFHALPWGRYTLFNE